MPKRHVLSFTRPNGDVCFTSFRPEASGIEVQTYLNSDLTSEQTMSREEGQRLWMKLLNAGWKPEPKG